MNVVLIVIDSLRADHVGCYGNNWIQTPNLDALAKEGVLFERCFPESLPTIPARRAMLTGNRVFPFRGWGTKPGDQVATPGWEPLGDTDIILSEIFFEEGYRTAFITDTYHLFKPSMNFHRGFREWRWIRGQEGDAYDSCPPSKDLIEPYIKPNMKEGSYVHNQITQYLANTADRKTEADYFSPMVFSEGVRWIEKNHDADKFFLYLDCFDPHEPWDPPKKYREMYDPNYKGKEIICPQHGNPLNYMTQEELKHTRALYAAEVTMVDKWLGKFIDRVREFGLLDKTAVIVISDHGHPIGEHGIIRKHGAAMFPTLMDCPFIIRHPQGIGAGKRIKEFVYHHDLFPTILGLADIDSPMKVDGEDVWPLVMDQGGLKREYVTCGYNKYGWVRDHEYVYTSEADGSNPRLFNIQSDPDHQKDVASNHPETLKKMYRRVINDAGGKPPEISISEEKAHASATIRTAIKK